MASHMGIAWSKVGSVSVGVRAFESTGIYPFNWNRVPEYFFSISDTIETVTSMQIAPPNVVPVCVTSTSVTNSKSVTWGVLVSP